MNPSRRIVTQWLQTDAAFGVSEVPIRAAAATATNRQARSIRAPAPSPRPALQPSAPRVPQARPPAAPLRVPAPRPAPAVPPSPPAQAGFAKTGNPPAAAAQIGDLPPLTRAQKEQALERLRQLTDEHCRPYINEISTRVVFGEGDIEAPLMFVGEGPGAEEDRTGRPFVGRSGQLLDKMIVAMGFGRGQVYIANVVKLRCAAPDETAGGRLKDRPPTPEEAARGMPILDQQIEIIRPKVIVTLGAPAVRHLTGNMQGVTKIRGTWLSYRGIPLMPTYHPSFLLRAYTPENRRKVWEDLQLAMGKIKG